MTTESLTPFLQGFTLKIKEFSRRLLKFLLLVFIIGVVAGLGYYLWNLHQKIEHYSAQFSTSLIEFSQKEKKQTANLAALEIMMQDEQIQQQQFADKLQKITSSGATSSSALGGVLSNLSNQLTVVQFLLANQQFAMAINLLTTIEAELSLLPLESQELILNALENDRERIQAVQTVRQQLLGQLQQLQQHINQQLLTHFGVKEETPAAVPETIAVSSTEKFFDELMQQLKKGVQIQHGTGSIQSLPAFYSAVMLQLSLYEAQFALTQGNWMEYQMALTGVQTWLPPSLLNEYPEMNNIAQVITHLTQQPPSFTDVNVNATQQAVITVAQELTP